MKRFTNDESVDENERWLRNYVFGDEWKKENDSRVPAYEEIVNDSVESPALENPGKR